jgi:hypothetical protein
MCQTYEVVFAIAGVVFSGAVGWFVAGFIGSPIRRFFDLRGEVIRQMARYGNIGARFKEKRGDPDEVEPVEISEKGEQRLQQAEEAFRDLAAEMRSFALNEPLAVKLLRVRHDPLKASAALFSVSNTIGTYGGVRNQKKQEVEAVLRFRDIGSP